MFHKMYLRKNLGLIKHIYNKAIYFNVVLLRCKNSSLECLNRQLFAIVFSLYKVNSQNMGAWVYTRRCLTFGVKIKLINIRGYTRIFFSVFTVFIASTLQLVHLPPFQSLDACLLKIVDAHLSLKFVHSHPPHLRVEF